MRGIGDSSHPPLTERTASMFGTLGFRLRAGQACAHRGDDSNDRNALTLPEPSVGSRTGKLHSGKTIR